MVPIGSCWKVIREFRAAEDRFGPRSLKYADKFTVVAYNNIVLFREKYEVLRLDGQYFYITPTDIYNYCISIDD